MKIVLLALAMLGLGLVGCETDTGCTDDFDCEGSKVCQLDTKECVPFVCKTADHCPAGQICEDNRCLAP